MLTHSPEGVRKECISAPFNFQHLTHTRPQQLPSLDQASERDLVHEFQTIRNSQAPRRQLFGIKAKDIHVPLPSAPPTIRSDSRPKGLDSPNASEAPPKSAPLSHHSRAGPPLEKNVPHIPQTIRKARSVESFSQPFVNPRSPKAPAESPDSHLPVRPPPRTSSRQAQSRPYEPPRSMIESPIVLNFGLAESGGEPVTTPGDLVARPHDVNAMNNSWPIGRSATIGLEESSRQSNLVVTPGYSTDLEDVPEELDGYFQYRTPGRTRATSGASSLRHSRSFPVTASSTRPSSRESGKPHSSTSQALTGQPEALDSPFRSLRSTSSTSNYRDYDPFAVVSETLDGSWEDVIDYCYDHAAEADCDFDWDRASIVEVAEVDDGLWMPKRPVSVRRRPSGRRPGSAMVGFSSNPQAARGTPNADRPQIIVPDVSMVPDLASMSATSLGTSSTIPTPSDNRGAPASFRLPAPLGGQNTSDDDRIVPILLPLPSKPHLYEEGLIDDLPYDYETGIYRPGFNEESEDRYSGPESIRSQLSKCSSEESFIKPAALKHISSSSVGSLPDLVYSRRSTRYHVPASDVIEERSPTLEPSDRHALPDIDGKRPLLARMRNSVDITPPSRLSQSVAPTIRASSHSTLMVNARRASSATRRPTPTVTSPIRPSQEIDAGTRDLLQIGRPRMRDSTLRRFPSTRSAKTSVVH